ncbi:hypothetical protein HWV62_39128 [Athelia sp. TMB]|nr:hypothetical protein HWV62_39128 [Athelia sp. TMB]
MASAQGWTFVSYRRGPQLRALVFYLELPKASKPPITSLTVIHTGLPSTAESSRGGMRSSASAKALVYARNTLQAATQLSSMFSPFPQVTALFQLAQDIISTIENTTNVEGVFANLAAQVSRTLKFIIDTLHDKDAETAAKLASDLKELQCVSVDILKLVETQQARGLVDRFLSSRADAADAVQCSKDLKDALDFFALRSAVQIRAGIQDLKDDISDLRKFIGDLQISPTPPKNRNSRGYRHQRTKSDVQASGWRTRNNAGEQQKRQSPALLDPRASGWRARKPSQKQQPQHLEPSIQKDMLTVPVMKRSKSADDATNRQGDQNSQQPRRWKPRENREPKYSSVLKFWNASRASADICPKVG